MNRGTGSSKKQNLPVVFQVAVSNLLPEHAQRADLFELTGSGQHYEATSGASLGFCLLGEESPETPSIERMTVFNTSIESGP